MRIFQVRVEEREVYPISPVAPPPRPQGRALCLRSIQSIQREVLRRPTFFEHYDGVVVDWRYLHQRDRKQLERESRWLELQGLRVIVDLTSGINLYPDLRLIDNLPQSYAQSMAAIEDVIGKMQLLPTQDVILALHRAPENNFGRDETQRSFVETFQKLSAQCRKQKINMHLRVRLSTPPHSLKEASEFLAEVDAPNLFLAPGTAVLLGGDVDLTEAPSFLARKVGIWMLNAPEKDPSGGIWNENAPIRKCESQETLSKVLAISPRSPVAFDAVYANRDSEYLDSKYLTRVLAGN